MAAPSARRRPSTRGADAHRAPMPAEPEATPRDPAAPPREPAAAPPPVTGWREQVAGAAGLNVIAGIWLIIAPFVLGYGNGDPYWNDIVFGAIVAVHGLIRMLGAYRHAWLSWVNAAIGVWVFVSAFWLDNTATAGWNDVILGAIVFLLGVAAASAGSERDA
jgi:SPW repeat